jgi:hypothetical protein
MAILGHPIIFLRVLVFCAMTKLSIRVSPEAELVRQGLQDLSAEIPRVGRRRIYDMINRITRTMEGYPPERPHQKYQRTGRYGASWHVEKLADGYSIYNNAEAKGRQYPRFVVGDAYGTGQAWMHQGRWPLLRDEVDKEVEKLPPEIEDEIVMVARRNNLDASKV